MRKVQFAEDNRYVYASFSHSVSHLPASVVRLNHSLASHPALITSRARVVSDTATLSCGSKAKGEAKCDLQMLQTRQRPSVRRLSTPPSPPNFSLFLSPCCPVRWRLCFVASYASTVRVGRNEIPRDIEREAGKRRTTDLDAGLLFPLLLAPPPLSPLNFPHFSCLSWTMLLPQWHMTYN